MIVKAYAKINFGLRVTGKRAAWLALLEIAPREPRLDAEELERLVARADAQLAGLREHHADAADQALVER